MILVRRRHNSRFSHSRSLHASFLGALCVAASGGAHAQVPPDGSLPQTPAAKLLTQTAGYSSTSPAASVEFMVMLNDGGGYPPFDSQWLELSAPHTAPMTFDVKTDPGCAQEGSRAFRCNVTLPLSTTDMSGSSVTITGRYYVSRAQDNYQAYVKTSGQVSGVAGTIGSAGTGGGTTLPVLTSIPPHGSFSADTSYDVDISATPGQYSPTARSLQLDIDVTKLGTNTSVIVPPYSNELLEFGSDSSPTQYVDIATQCTRSTSDPWNLSCSVPFSMPVVDAAEPVRTLRARYYADAPIPNSTFTWTGYSQGTSLITAMSGSGGTTLGGAGNPDCPNESAPMMPTTVGGNGTFTFEIPSADVCGGEFWIDPPVATGYTYTVSGAQFESLTLPSLASVNDADGYEVSAHTGSQTEQWSGLAGDDYAFAIPPTSFHLSGIDPQVGLDPTDSQAFPLGITLTNVGNSGVTITQTPDTQIYPPVANQAPIADAGTFVYAVGQSGLSLTAAASSDPDGDSLTYKWTQIGGASVTILNASTSETIQTTLPVETGSPQFAVFELVVNDGTTDSAPAHVVVQTR